MMRSYERRALGALLFLVSRSEPGSPDNCSLSVETRRFVVFVINASISTGATWYCCMYLVLLLLLVLLPGSAQLVFGI